ncbi:hypothetical protein QO002_001796 [Pararhizobium capsulatum DSM 1112]|uniref:Uncharacterized protein n=1 Tax=Pararhizobium capsulatum DSM 1112 TaxID=1121113 RepID=A0ABU0BP06_9HYPH|nr:hypothetical protein [Pararhizobium capsulatum DSM 1112]
MFFWGIMPNKKGLRAAATKAPVGVLKILYSPNTESVDALAHIG